MSMAQDIRDAMRAAGANASAQEIADRCERDLTGGVVTQQLASGEKHGWVIVDRSTRPFRYTLDEAKARKTEAFVAENRSPKDAAANASKSAVPQDRVAQPRLGRALDAAKASDSEWSQRVATERATDPAPAPLAPMPAALPDTSQSLSIDRAIILRLCALALCPDDLTATDRRTIANTIKAAA